MVESSLTLLDDGVRSAFDQLGAISGPFDREMAEAVVAGIDRPVGELLDELVAASLVVADTSGEAVIYRLLHPVRSVASERLRQAGSDAGAIDRAVGHTVDVAMSVMTDASAGWSDQLRRLIARYDNLISSLRWAVEHDETAKRSMLLLTVLWGVIHQAHRAEVAEVGERVLERWPDPSERFWADAATTVATCRNLLGDGDRAIELATTALEQGRPAPFANAALRRVIAQSHRLEGLTEEACEGFADAAAAAEAGGVHSLAMEMRVDHAVLVDELGDRDRAEELLASVLAEAERRGAGINISWARCGLAAVHQHHRDPDILTELQGVIDHASEIEYQAGLAFALRLVAAEHIERGDWAVAAASLLELQEALLVRGGLGDLRMMLDHAAVLLERLGDPRWADVAVTAAALPVTSTVAAASTFQLLDRAAGSGEVLAVRDVYELCRIRLGEIARAGGPPDASLSGAESSVATDIEPERPVTPPPTSPEPGPAGPALVLEGDVWRWSYAGESFAVKASKGMTDIARLLAEPRREISAMDLMGSVKVADSGTESLDAQARREVEERIRELQGDIDEAEDHHDFVRAERASAELDQLVEELSAAVGLGGKARAPGGDTERARSAVTQRIRSTISRIDKMHPKLGGHLATSIETGTFCSYRPVDDVVWTVER